jgi:SAM-dependent methyltransferase
MKDLYDKNVAIEFYDNRYEQGYMEEWDELKKNKVKETLTLLNLPQKGKALDFGCGNGVFTRLIKDILPGWEVYGVEISKIAVNNAQKKNPDCIFFEAGEAGSYKTQFDFLFSHHVIEHVQDLNETFELINSYLKPVSSQLHILPCGNPGSYEYNICLLKKNGIEKEKANRFFFEEPGHLRRLTTVEFCQYEEKINFKLQKEFYSNQHFGAIDWITKSSPRFVKKLTNADNAIDTAAAEKLKKLKKKLIPLTYLQFPFSKYSNIKTKWEKGIIDYIMLLILYFPSLISKYFFYTWQKRSLSEWNQRKTEQSGSEMFLYFTR